MTDKEAARRCYEIVCEIDDNEWFANQTLIAEAIKDAIAKEFDLGN